MTVLQSRLTQNTLATLAVPVDVAQAYYWDTEPKGFGVVVGRTGKMTFVVQARVAGKTVKSTIGVAGKIREDGHAWTVLLARQRAKELLGAMASGVVPDVTRKSTRPGGPTVREALEFHISKMERGENRRRKVCSPRSIATLRGFVELHLERYLDEPLVTLTADVIDELRTKIERTTERKAGSNPKNPPGRASSNRMIAAVSAIWRTWHKRHGLPVSNPTERLTQGSLAPRDTRVANDELPAWYAKLFATLPGKAEAHGRTRARTEIMSPVRRDLQLVSMFTGVRAEGVRSLRWLDVDFDAELLHIAKAKGDQPYTLPMTKTVREVLELRERENADQFEPHGGDHGFVFPSLARDARTVIATAEPKERHAKRDAKGRIARDDDGNMIRENYLPGTHANRRTFNSIAIEIGVPAEARESLMNHEGRGVNVKHYGVPQNWDYLRECADKIEAAIWARIRGETKAVRRSR